MAEEKWGRFFDFSASDEKRTKGKCKLCPKNYKDNPGIYSNFIKHLKRIHPDELENVNSEETEEVLAEVAPNTNNEKATSSEAKSKEKRNDYMMSITKNLIIRSGLPLSLVEQAPFREFLKDLRVKIAPLSAKRIKNVAIPVFKERVLQQIRSTLTSASDITITIDGWSDRRCRSYLGITGHYLDDRMAPQTCLIDFFRIKCPHTGINIQHLTEEVLEKFNIKDKIFKVVTDNASNMIKAYEFGLFNHHETEVSTMEQKISDGQDFEPGEDEGSFHSIDYEVSEREDI